MFSWNYRRTSLLMSCGLCPSPDTNLKIFFVIVYLWTNTWQMDFEQNVEIWKKTLEFFTLWKLLNSSPCENFRSDISVRLRYFAPQEKVNKVGLGKIFLASYNIIMCCVQEMVAYILSYLKASRVGLILLHSM